MVQHHHLVALELALAKEEGSERALEFLDLLSEKIASIERQSSLGTT